MLRKDQVDTWEDNKDVKMLKKELWTRRTTAEIMMLKRYKSLEDSNLLEEIQRNNTKKQEVGQELKKENSLAWKQDGIIYMEGRIYIPNNRKLKEWILQKNHDLVDISHPRQQRMLELVKRNYWWPGIKEDIKKYMQEYIKYQQNKVQHQQKSGELYPLEIPQGP